MGQIYLLHFSKPYKHAKHYLGYVDGDSYKCIVDRLEKHRNGTGAKLTKVVSEAGIDLELVRFWCNVDRNFERSLKNRKNTPRLCPICNKKHL